MLSMTGFGRSVVTTSLGTLTTEIRSVNHRYCQVSLRLPPEFAEFEPRTGTLIKSWATRGQIHVHASFSPEPGAVTPHVRFNAVLAQTIHAQATALQVQLGLEGGLTVRDLINIPGVMKVETPELDAEERWALLETGIKDAWRGLARMREAEGAALQTEMRERLDRIRLLRNRIAENVPDLITEYRDRLTKRIRELTQNGYEIDEGRIVMEAGILADRADISEELARLASHCDQFEKQLYAEEPAGRQMDFLLQEMNREANTIASKTGDAEVVSLSVALKTEIERLREQAQNVE